MSNPFTTSSPSLGASAPSESIPVHEADTIHGQPAVNVEFDPTVYQYYNDTCAIQSQHLVLQQFGIDVTQDELIEVAKENGWYAEGYGTPMNMVGKLLEHYGVEVTGSEGNNIFNLSNELAQGHQVIVGVDSQELVDPEAAAGIDETYGEAADHALVVVGIDTSDPDNVQVIVTDPGTGSRQLAYPADQFMDAWKDSNCFMVSTDDVPTNPTYDCSPVESFGGIPTSTLSRLSDMDIDITGHETLFDDFFSALCDGPLDFSDLVAQSQYDPLFDDNTLSDTTDDVAATDFDYLDL